MLNMKSKIFKYIYAMLCLLPAIAVGVTCLYVANNDNAYQSYSGSVLESTDSYIATPKYVQGTLGDGENCEVGKIYSINGTYTFNDLNLNADSYFELQLVNGGEFYANDIDDRYFDDWSPNFYYTDILVTISQDMFRFNAFYGDSVYQVDAIEVQFYKCVFEFKYINSIDNDISKISAYFTTTDYQDYTYTPFEFNNTSLDNVFYYSLDKVENSDVFSWVKSNFLYEGVNQFVGIFGGTNSNISFYLTWVLTISLCYLGFEVLMLFINMARNLIHSFTDKDRW